MGKFWAMNTVNVAKLILDFEFPLLEVFSQFAGC